MADGKTKQQARRAILPLLGALVVAGAGVGLWLSMEHVAADLEHRARSAHRRIRGIRRMPAAATRITRRVGKNGYHARMTRDATEETVLGDFDDATLDYMGFTARMFRGDDGSFRITVVGPGGPRTVRVLRTIGSHRYQQYLALEDDTWIRLPLAWQLQEQRWIHMNGAFLTPDPEGGAEGRPIRVQDYDRHVVRWNDNCVFCHNVGADPGLDPDNGRFDTTVAELGIACEACHGPGSVHVELNQNPIRRYALHLGDEEDPSIVDPMALDPSRSADICGHCHGQRMADQVADFLEEGDPFVPGDDLALYTSPLWRDTTMNDDEGLFEMRFWADGTPRLSAYELQGLLLSPCAQEGELTCVSCHSIHRGDPAGRIRPEALGDAGCTQCHEALASDDAIREHTGHDPSGAGARCTECHMPRISYGLVAVLHTHRIESPDPALSARYGRPDACTGCHVERTRAWASREAARLFPDRTAPIGGDSRVSQTCRRSAKAAARRRSDRAGGRRRRPRPVDGRRGFGQTRDPPRSALRCDGARHLPGRAAHRVAVRPGVDARLGGTVHALPTCIDARQATRRSDATSKRPSPSGRSSVRGRRSRCPCAPRPGTSRSTSANDGTGGE